VLVLLAVTMHLPITVIMLGLLTGCASTPPPADTPARVPVDHGPQAPATGPIRADLRAALLDLSERDQAARRTLIELMADAEPAPGGGVMLDAEQGSAMQAMMAIDAESTAFLKETIVSHGWPTVTMVGPDGAGAAWLLAQHADADPALQAEVLELMRPLVDRGEADPKNFALLTDRVLTGRGEPQMYGTQFSDDGQGVMRPLPIADPRAVDERRATVGLPSLAEYAAQLSEAYGQPASPEPLDDRQGPS